MHNPSQSRIQQAYELDQNLDRFEEFAEDEHKFDAEVIKPKGYPKYGNIKRYFYYPEPITDFKLIEMEGTLELMKGVDYLYTRPNLPIMSRRMLYILNSMGEFQHQVIPVSIEDNVVPIYNHKTGQRSGKVNSTDYVAVHMLEYLDVFDYEKSVYEPSRYPNSKSVRSIDKMILKEPSEGFPPLFKIPEDSLKLYVSPQAKSALEDAEITGIDFIDIAWD